MGSLAALFIAFSVMLFGISLIRANMSGQHEPIVLSRIPEAPPSPHGQGGEAGLSKGRFLVAGASISDPRFSKTVILIIEYGQNGAAGLIINRPSDVKLSTVLPNIEGLTKRTDIVYIGGPVKMNQILLLMRSARRPEESSHVVENIYVSTSPAVLKRLIDTGETDKRFRAYSGYAGWAPGQLQREVARGDWHVVQADAKAVFEKDSSEIWPDLIRRSSGLWVSLDPRSASMQSQSAYSPPVVTW